MTISGQSMQSNPYSPALQYSMAGINDNDNDNDDYLKNNTVKIFLFKQQ